MTISIGYLRNISKGQISRSIETNKCCVDMTKELQQGIFTYPELSPPIQIESGVGAYELGAPVELIPDSTPPFNVEYRIMDIFISEMSQKDQDYTIILYQNGGLLRVCSTTARLNNVISSHVEGKTESKPIPGGTGIYCRVACAQAGGHTVDIRLQYKNTGQA